MVVFRQPPSNGKLLAAAGLFVPLLLAASLIPIMLTFDSEQQDAGLGVAVGLTLLVAFAAFCVFYRMTTPMVIDVSSSGLTLTNQKTCTSREFRWDDFTYSLIEGTGGFTLMLHKDRETFVIRQHPTCSKSPPRFVELCEVLEKKGREYAT